MRLVVTGAAGLTGAAVAGELLRRGHQVIAVTRHARSTSWIPEGASAVLADCADPLQMRPLLRGSDGLVHVAGILLARGIVSADLSGLSRVVVVSTAGIYSRFRVSADLYRQNEEVLRAAFPASLFVRPTMIYGSIRDRNVRRVIAFARRWRLLPLPSGGRSLLQPIHYADLAAVIAQLVDTEASGVVDAGGPVPITVRQAAEEIFAALGLPVVLVPIPIVAALPLAAALDRVFGSRWRERLLRLREDRSVDITRLLELTQVRPRSFREGVRDEVAEVEGRASG